MMSPAASFSQRARPNNYINSIWRAAPTPLFKAFYEVGRFALPGGAPLAVFIDADNLGCDEVHSHW
jgi:hypothetical protein